MRPGQGRPFCGFRHPNPNPNPNPTVTQAYAVVVVGLSALGVWITPHMGWGTVVPQPAAAALAAVLWLLCWALPWSFVYLLSLSLWGLTLYASWQVRP